MKSILLFIRLSSNLTYITIFERKYLIGFSLCLGHLHKHKFKHSFLYSLNPLCSCNSDTVSTCHCLFYYPNIVNDRTILLDILSNINEKIMSVNDTIIFTISFSSKRLVGPLIKL